MNYSYRFSSIFVLMLIFILAIPSFALAFEKEINNLSISMAGDIANADKKMIAVVDFTDLQGNVTELGRFLAEEFSVALAGADKGFEVVDRTHLKSIIAEHKLSATGLIDPKTARKLGEIAGVEALITGTITPFGDSVRLSVKILDTATAKVIGASRGNIAKTQAIEELLSRGVESGQSFGTRPSSTGYVSSSGSSKSKKVFQGKFLRASVIRISKVPERKKLTISIRIENITDQDLKLHLFGGFTHAYAQAISNKGEECRARSRDVSGVFVGNQTHRKIDKVDVKKEVTSISRGSSIILGMVMECSDGPEGDVYDISAEFAGFLANEQEVFSIAFSGVK